MSKKVAYTYHRLEPKMKPTWLIQRLIKPTCKPHPDPFGAGFRNGGLSDKAMEMLDPIFHFDGMGSAEFERGNIPSVLAFLAEQIREKDWLGRPNMVTGVWGSGYQVYYICPRVYEQSVQDLLSGLLLEESCLGLKDPCGLKEVFYSEGKRGKYRNIGGWLEVTNGFMFFTDPKMFAQSLRHLRYLHSSYYFAKREYFDHAFRDRTKPK